MKGLLQSKRFRKNLGKWLFMYAGVMLLLTTVITYSKYITSLQNNHKASAAKFDLILEPFNIDDSTHNVNDELIYKFYVDVKDIDVKSKLKLLTFVDSSFTIESISDGFMTEENNESTQMGKQMRVYTAEIPKDINGRKEFEIHVKYNGTDPDAISTDINNPTLLEDIVTIGYKIEQMNLN